ncbi:Ankyrin repeat protein, putative [Theobroma cacao]|uniref:Ankyrin repeat protein, putative n=1 Tax=Theobroma cacao TaxID=3641 RepID=A0A061FPX2_THECC|nr:Ankyrin repeat protein, putative [Theobroma cacao]
MDERLRTVAKEGDTNALHECIREDPNVLRHIDEVEFVDTPLHIATTRGHAGFSTTIMYLKPSFFRKLNQKVYSPIHLGLQNEHTNAMLHLLAIDKDLVRLKGKEGYTTIHYRENYEE